MSKHGLLMAMALGFALVASADPYAVYYYPNGIQAGTCQRVVVGGQAIGGVRGGYITGDGVKIVKVTPVPGFPRARGKGQNPWMYDWIYEILSGVHTHHDLPPEGTAADSDWNMCSWWAAMHEHDQLEVEIMGRDMFVPKNDLQASPSLAQLIILDIEAERGAKPGRRDIVVYDANGVSVPHVFYVSSEPRVVEPFYVIPPRKAGDPPTWTPPPPAKVPVMLDGQVWPGETDTFKLQLKGGTRLTCVLTGRELLPYLGDAVPGFFNPVMRLADSKGRELAFADDFCFLPDPILSCMIPTDGIYTLEVHDNLYRGRSDFVYTVACFEDEHDGPKVTAQERAFCCFPKPYQHEAPTEGLLVKRGVVDCPGRTVRYDFKIEEPGIVDFDLFARRDGSPLDGVLRLYGPIDRAAPSAAAPLIATWDDEDKFLVGSVPQALTDPHGRWNFRTIGNYRVTVSNRTDSGGDDFTYTLAVTRPEPSFEVYAERSSLFVGSGRAKFKVRVVRKDGFTGQIKLEDTPEFEFTLPYIPEGEDKAEIEVMPKIDWIGLKVVEFTAVGEVGPDKVKRVKVTPSDSVEQAFAYTHLLPQRGFFICRPE